MKLIKPSEVPERKRITGKKSIVPEILKLIPKGKTGEIINGEEMEINGQAYKINTGSIRGYIRKLQKQGQLAQYQIQSETILDHNKPNHKNEKLYITHN